MSSFVVTEKHINALVNYIPIHDRHIYYYYNGEWKRITAGGEEDSGAILYAQNLASYYYRYRNNTLIHSQEEIPFRHRFSMVVHTPLQILRLVNCYIWQSCETTDWPATEAFSIAHAIRDAAILSLPGYEDAPWEI